MEKKIKKNYLIKSRFQFVFKGAPSGLTQFLATESPLKMTKIIFSLS